MLAPPGYAKMTSTPSRSRASTRMSRPNLTGPTSARCRSTGRAGALAVDFFFAGAVSVVLLITSYYFKAGGMGNKNPTTVASRGFLSKFSLFATRACGSVGYDDYQCQNYL